MSFICIDCSPQGRHPIYQEEAEYREHRKVAHDEPHGEPAVDWMPAPREYKYETAGTHWTRQEHTLFEAEHALRLFDARLSELESRLYVLEEDLKKSVEAGVIPVDSVGG